MNKPTNAVRVLSLLLAVMMLLGSMTACGGSSGGKTTAGAKTVTFTAVHGDGSEKKFTVKTDAEFLGEALLNEGIIAGENGQYGLFVKTVDGETANDANQEWWCLTKGGEDVMTGVDTTPIADGEAYEFTLKTGW